VSFSFSSGSSITREPVEVKALPLGEHVTAWCGGAAMGGGAGATQWAVRSSETQEIQKNEELPRTGLD